MIKEFVKLNQISSIRFNLRKQFNTETNKERTNQQNKKASNDNNQSIIA